MILKNQCKTVTTTTDDASPRDPPILQLVSLPDRLPKTGKQLLMQFGVAVVYRLCIEPTTWRIGKEKREILVVHDAHDGEQETVFEVGWARFPNVVEDDLARYGKVCNSHRVTEDAACGLAALL